MNIKRINPETLTLAELNHNANYLYCLSSEPNKRYDEQPARRHYELKPLINHSLEVLGRDHILLLITDDEEEIEESTAPTERRTREERTYALNSSDPTESIFVEFKPTRGEIRVNFKEKECAEVYFNYLREQFYTRTTGASVITVSNIYQDLGVVNWNKEDCDDWGWYTIDSGTCRHISEVRKTKNSKMFGFTLSHPTKLYETKKREEA